MSEHANGPSRHQRWAHLRFAVVGTLLAAPPGKGALRAALRALADKLWRHPISEKEVRFGVSTIERWYYRARRAQRDPVSVLRRKLRRDLGRQTAISAPLQAVLLAQYGDHPHWSVQLHADNLRAQTLATPDLGSAPSYASVRRFLLARVAISGVIGVAVWLTFRLLDLEQAAVSGVVSGILFTVPFLGPAVVIAGAAIAGILQTGSIGTAAAAGGACAVIAAIEGNLLGPWLMSRAGRMSAVAVFISLLFWGWLWGAWGLLLAVPITASIKAVCERVDDLDPFAELLRP